MSLVANYRCRIRSDSIIFVKRSTRGMGKLSVKKGQEVAPEQILGKFHLKAGFGSVNLAKSLGVSFDDAPQYLQRKKGEKIFKGELLAFKKGIFKKKVVTAPTDSIVSDYNFSNGELLLEYLPRDQQLIAGVFGIVDDVNNSAGEVLIKTMVHEVFGIAGSGIDRSGVLFLSNGKENLMNKYQVHSNWKNHIVVAGALVYTEAIQQAIQFGVQGIITGGINARDFTAIAGGVYSQNLGTDVGTSIVVTEGFGPVPIGDDIYNLLKIYQGKFIFINGNLAKILLPVLNEDSIITLRKTFLPKEKKVSNIPQLEVDSLKIGDKVRVIWPPYQGVQGKIIGIDKTPTSLPSGISTFMVTLETPRIKIKVSYTNIELID